MTQAAERSRWADRAASLYDEAYATRYRAHDEGLTEADSAPYAAFVSCLRAACERFARPIDALDLGCGTGRYFSALRGVRTLVALDASAAMLERARHPAHEELVTIDEITLVHGDLLAHDFGAGRFDLVYSIGVLAEHVPLQAPLLSRVARWLRPRGRFAFSTVHPESASIPKTAGRRAGMAAAPLLPGPLRRLMRGRLLSGGLYADEARIEELLAREFVIESLDRLQSEAHLHCLCIARKGAA
jgi:SAM-dependent methyltransferase